MLKESRNHQIWHIELKALLSSWCSYQIEEYKLLYCKSCLRVKKSYLQVFLFICETFISFSVNRENEFTHTLCPFKVIICTCLHNNFVSLQKLFFSLSNISGKQWIIFVDNIYAFTKWQLLYLNWKQRLFLEIENFIFLFSR